MTKAESAVAYLIRRLHADADLRHHMLGTEALARLLAADSERTGQDDVAMLVDIQARHAEQEPAKLVRCRRDLTEIFNLAADCLDSGCSRAEEALRAIQDRTEDNRD